MAWTTPKTWVSGEKLKSVDFNAQIRDNFDYLKGVVDAGISSNPTASQTGQSGTVTTGETTIASASITVSGSRPVLILVDFVIDFANVSLTLKIKEDTAALRTLSTGSWFGGQKTFGLSHIYTPSSAGTYTYAITGQSSGSQGFQLGSIQVMEI